MSSIVRLLGALSSAIGECSIEGLPAGSRVTSRGGRSASATNSTMLNHHSSRVEEWQDKRSGGPSGMWLRCRMRQVNLECLLRGLHAELASCVAVTLNMTGNKEASMATSIDSKGGWAMRGNRSCRRRWCMPQICTPLGPCYSAKIRAIGDYGESARAEKAAACHQCNPPPPFPHDRRFGALPAHATTGTLRCDQIMRRRPEAAPRLDGRGASGGW